MAQVDEPGAVPVGTTNTLDRNSHRRCLTAETRVNPTNNTPAACVEGVLLITPTLGRAVTKSWRI